MAVWGLDVEQVQQLSAQLNNKANDIQGILTQLTTMLNNTQWTGPDHDAFMNDWSGQHTTSLKQVIAALQEAGQKAAANALAQQNASNTNG